MDVLEPQSLKESLITNMMLKLRIQKSLEWDKIPSHETLMALTNNLLGTCPMYTDWQADKKLV